MEFIFFGLWLFVWLDNINRGESRLLWLIGTFWKGIFIIKEFFVYWLGFVLIRRGDSTFFFIRGRGVCLDFEICFFLGGYRNFVVYVCVFIIGMYSSSIIGKVVANWSLRGGEWSDIGRERLYGGVYGGFYNVYYS